MILSPVAAQRLYDNLNIPAVGAKLFTYIAGTTIKQATYKTASGTANTNPIILNFRGECDLWLDPALTYKFVFAPSTDTDPPTNPFWTVDNIPGGYNGTILWTQVVYSQTAAEIAALVTPVNYSYPPGQLYRQVTNTTPGTTDCAAGFQAALDSASALNPVVYFQQEVGISKPLLLKSTHADTITIDGTARVTSIINPLAADIKQAAQNINCLFFNQKNSGNLHLKGFRCGPDVHAYTGIFFYCKEGGGADASGQALFSAVIDDCWFSFSTNNTGYFRGGFSNMRASKSVFESTKNACFRLEGVGNGDQQYIGNVMNACYDSFILGTDDTLTKSLILVDGLHAYQHLRGPLIEIKNLVESNFNNIILEPDAANVGTTGLFKFTDCTDIICTNFLATTANGAPKCATGIEIVNAFKGKFANGKIAATTGLKLSGAGALDLTIDNVDFVGCDNAVDWNSGTLSGKIVFRNCKFNDSQAYGLLVTAGTHSWDLTMIDCEIINAGLRATATDRNFDLNTSGKVKLIRCKIGQDNGSAAAAYYIRAVGAGTFEVIDPIIVGTAPTGFSTGAQTVSLDGVDSSMPNMPAFTPTAGGSSTYTGSQLGFWSIKQKVLRYYGDFTVNLIGTGSATLISGLPYTSHGTLYGGGLVHFFSGSASNVSGIYCSVAPAGTSITLRSLTAEGAATANNAIMQNGTRLILEGSYPLP